MCEKEPRYGPTSSYCRACNTIYHKNYQKTRYGTDPAFRETHREAGRQWYQDNREHVLEYSKEYNKRHRVPKPRQPSVRQLARLNGDQFYQTGKPCKHGHLCLRWTCDGHCVECNRISSEKQNGKRREAKLLRTK